jgi:hypothetical protein
VALARWFLCSVHGSGLQIAKGKEMVMVSACELAPVLILADRLAGAQCGVGQKGIQTANIRVRMKTL